MFISDLLFLPSIFVHYLHISQQLCKVDGLYLIFELYCVMFLCDVLFSLNRPYSLEALKLGIVRFSDSSSLPLSFEENKA